MARYLGHNIRIHDDFYRLKLDTLQIAKVSKLLFAVQQGRIGDYIGMDLDEIDVSPDGMYTAFLILFILCYRNVRHLPKLCSLLE